ncbi:ATP-binding protein [Pectobacterium aroidearum]|uniref:ATP-binding protein n=1 Tax=Pectobacterium aroidearum TaxID=1201031 RepID=A0AAW3SSS8_9GAMM|nr:MULTISPECIES: AAA family ATPase [Pectobacterium]MBA5198321.1 ATP-binding protein [Pectobacterium aroidearum]MBA5203639.1 ATP-binding protein [Pectobacterium aroidearum]MBA5227175.1 ATP-binding protein [Pectobacterium aroidearum]MBA5231114.1 ATP-binding protein [Pectobacterium aroidearum]MBA5736260.1 ATP-binding protein [Pectobacterium aroidearum]
MNKISILMDRILNTYDNEYFVIIGKNGEGKSQLLLDIIKTISASDLHFKNVISVSTSAFDRFPLNVKTPKKYEPMTYSYVGVRGGASNNVLSLMSSVSTGFISKYVSSPRDLHRFSMVLEEIGFSTKFEYVYKLIVNPDGLYRQNMLIEDEYYIVDGDKRTKLDCTEEEFDEIRRFLNYVQSICDKNNNFRLSVNPRSNYLNDNNSMGNIGFFHYIFKMIPLGIVKLIDLRMEKYSKGVISLRRASSGEQCILLSLLGIAANITDNSIILIDEPEISLHPEWQQRYINLLMNTFEGFYNCKFIIATHSPLVVSNLKSSNCYIFPMSESEVINAKEYNNRSSDYQLAELFEFPGFQNEYIFRTAINLFAKIRANKYFDKEDKKTLERLSGFKYNLEKQDPNYDLINALENMKVMYG